MDSTPTNDSIEGKPARRPGTVAFVVLVATAWCVIGGGALADVATASSPSVAGSLPEDDAGGVAARGTGDREPDDRGPDARHARGGDRRSTTGPALSEGDRRTKAADRRLPVAAGTSGSALPAQPLPAGALRGRMLVVVLVLVILVGLGLAALGIRPGLLEPGAINWRWPPGRAADGGTAAGDDTRSSAPGGGELLTDEERILELLEQNDGRIKQQCVVERTDWSKAKVSRLLSSMEDDDRIVRIRLGREKLIFLDGHEPSGVRSTLYEDR